MDYQELMEGLKKEQESWEDKHLKKSSVEPAFTDAGIPVNVLYTPLDMQDPNHYSEKIGFPGQYPFTRGIQPTMYRGQLWTFRQYAGYSSAEESNRRYRYLLDQGNTGLSVAFDLPTQLGFDPDDPSIIQEEVGRLGVSINSLADMEKLFDGIPLQNITTSFTINAPAAIIIAMYIVAGEKQGVPPEKIRGTVQNDILKEYIARGMYIFPPAPSLKLSADIIEYCSKNVPRFNSISISGAHVKCAGAKSYQDIAYAISEAIVYIDEVLKRGIDIDKFASRLSFVFVSDMELMEEVAKYRACRRIWANLIRNKYGSRDDRSQMMRFFASCQGSALRANEPLNNIVRAAMMCLASVFAGVQAFHVMAYDEAIEIPTEESARIALRTQQILAHECGITKTVDPLGGSYYLESLTDQIEKKVYEEMKWVEQNGGMVECIQKGLIQAKIAGQAYDEENKITSGEKPVVALNKYVDEKCGAATAINFNVHKPDYSIAELQIAKLAEIKRNRDNAKVEKALRVLRDATAANKENLMPYIIDAVRVYASIGEITSTLKSVYGSYKCPSGI